jgi:hypothetical protein
MQSESVSRLLDSGESNVNEPQGMGSCGEAFRFIDRSAQHLFAERARHGPVALVECV